MQKPQHEQVFRVLIFLYSYSGFCFVLCFRICVVTSVFVIFHIHVVAFRIHVVTFAFVLYIYHLL